MTRMSQPHATKPSDPAANPARSWRGSPMARRVHEAVTLVYAVAPIAMLTLGGCVIPPSLQVDNQDAGVNSPPAILGVTSDLQALPEPGPVLFDRGASAGNLSLSLIDP